MTIPAAFPDEYELASFVPGDAKYAALCGESGVIRTELCDTVVGADKAFGSLQECKSSSTLTCTATAARRGLALPCNLWATEL